jgi:hypothetical protein
LRHFRSLFWCAFCVLLANGVGTAATLTVCASGCGYTDPQAAINAAVPGDTILLRAGQTFIGHYTLKAKSGTSTSFITIKSDATSGLPGDGVRIVPGTNVSLSALPRLVGKGGAYKTTPIIRAEPGAHHYRLQFLNLDGTANIGYETVVEIGSDSTSERPHDIVLDRVYIHGHKYKGQKRGISLNGANVTIQNSYIADIKSVSSDAQAIAGWNGPGPFTIVNNYVEGAAENIMFGGADPAISNLVPSNITIRGNHINKPTSWMNAVLSTPRSPSASATTGGSLSSGTHYFKVVAVMAAASATLVSLPSAEVKATVSSSGAVNLTWSAVAGADKYRVYRGTSAGGQTRYLQTSGASTSFKYTGASEISGTPPTKAHKWLVKNLIELKNAQRVTVEANVIEHSWSGGQQGYALMLTPRNSGGNAPWSRVQDLTFRNNIIRHASGVVEISGYDDVHTSGQAKNIKFLNNLMYDIDPSKWYGTPKPILCVNGPANVTFDHNTLFHNISSVVYADGDPTYGFVYTNNIQPHNKYGIMGGQSSTGIPTLTKYFPSANVTYNVFAGGPASSYPTPNAFPTMTEWNASFANVAGEDFRVLSTSVFYSAGSGGSVPGADTGVINTATATVLSGSAAPPPSDGGTGGGGSTTNQPPVADAGGPYSGVVAKAVAVSGAGSSDADGTIVDYRWWWNDDIVVRASKLPSSAIHGTRWIKASVSGAADGVALQNPNKGEAKRSSASASPTDYVEFQFNAAAGVKYHLWFRMKAENDYYGNDSVFVQFSGSLNSSGSAAWRIGTTSALDVILEEGNGAGLAGWGWNDQSWGGTAEPITFATSGPQKLRIQQREDGVSIDQVVISAEKYLSTRPGSVRGDATIISSTLGSTSGASVTHTYSQAGSYPVSLVVTDDKGATASDGTTVAVASGTTAQQPAAGDIVLHATDFGLADLAGRWALVQDASAADGLALDNPNAGAAKIATALASPVNFAEVTFDAEGGVPYRLWLRLRAAGDSYANDSVYVQFSGSVTSTGSAVNRIGTTSALPVVLEEGRDAGVSGWGWNDANYGSLAGPVRFATSGIQTMRIQQREDGVRIDQIVLSPETYFLDAPGDTKDDTTIVQ